MRWIYISPHLDDAVLSAGGWIYDQARSGIPVEIWTITAGFPPEYDEYSLFAQVNHALWGFASATDTVRARRAEDEAAANILGANVFHFDFLDCIYRLGKNGDWLYDNISLTPHAEDAHLPPQIADAISTRLRPDDRLICQLSVGSHVDHVLVRQGVELLGRPLVYSVDVPYVFTRSEELALKSAGMKEKVHEVTEAGLRSWQEAVLAYKSQLACLGDEMKTPEKAVESIRSYWAERGGIRLFELN